jgi:protein-disulfide isomerase
MTPIRSITTLALAGLTLSLAACDKGGTGAGASADALPKAAAPQGKPWSQVVTATRDGFVMGNPNAPIKLVEFASPTCSHCAEFSTTGSEPLKTEFVDSGRVSWEVRPFMLNPIDLVVATIINCSGSERFFPLLENVFASQADLFRGVQRADQAAAQAAMQQPENRRFQALAGVLGLKTFFAARGMSETEIDQCLANPAAVNRWAESTQRNGTEFEVAGTPTFLINGESIGTVTWTEMAEKLRAAGAR